MRPEGPFLQGISEKEKGTSTLPGCHTPPLTRSLSLQSPGPEDEVPKGGQEGVEVGRTGDRGSVEAGPLTGCVPWV